MIVRLAAEKAQKGDVGAANNLTQKAREVLMKVKADRAKSKSQASTATNGGAPPAATTLPAAEEALPDRH